MQVIQSGSSAGLQNKHQPMKQYVTRKNHIAYRGKEVKMWCIFGGTPLPEIRCVETVLYCTVLYCTVLYSPVLYCTLRSATDFVSVCLLPCCDV